MLFDFGKYTKESFVVTAIGDIVASAPKKFQALEWEPEDARGVRYLNNNDLMMAGYTAVGVPVTEKMRVMFEKTKVASEAQVPVSFLNWRPGDALGLADGSADVALLLSGAEERLGKKGLQKLFKETARVLKRRGQFIVFHEANAVEPLPVTAEVYFTATGTTRDKSTGLVCRCLAKKPKKAATAAPAAAAPAGGAERKPKAPRSGDGPVSAEELLAALE